MLTPLQIAVSLLVFYGILQAHPIDIHLPTAEEHYMLEEVKKERECQKAEKVLEDEDASLEEKTKALETVANHRGIV